MTFDVAAHQRERIRDLEREVRGLEAIRDQLVRMLADVIVHTDARWQVEAMSQDEFMHELALQSDRFTSRPEGSSHVVASRTVSPSGRRTSRLELVSASNRSREDT